MRENSGINAFVIPEGTLCGEKAKGIPRRM